jgi:hypothetical protein
MFCFSTTIFFLGPCFFFFDHEYFFRPTIIFLKLIFDHDCLVIIFRLVVLSGRSRAVLEKWLRTPDGQPIDCAIGAENGVFFRQHYKSEWENMGLVQNAETWKNQVLPIMQFFSERTPGEWLFFFLCFF